MIHMVLVCKLLEKRQYISPHVVFHREALGLTMLKLFPVAAGRGG